MPILFTFKPRVHKIFFDKKDSWIKKKAKKLCLKV